MYEEPTPKEYAEARAKVALITEQVHKLFSEAAVICDDFDLDLCIEVEEGIGMYYAGVVREWFPV